MLTMMATSPLRRRVDRLIALIDETLNRQVNEILHHPRFQALEASWRGLALLVRHAGQGDDIKVKLLNVSWQALARDMERASEFDQSQLFHLVYSREFGMPGGEPFGLIIADYILQPGIKDGHDVVSTLTQISMTAAAAFCPFIAGAGPGTVGLSDFTELNRAPDLSRLPQNLLHKRWEGLRKRDDTRFIGLAGPRVLLRMPYRSNVRSRVDPFPFREAGKPDGSHLLWGNGAFAFALVVMRNYLASGWFADIRGVSQDAEDGGFLPPDQIAPYDLGFESGGLSAQPPVEIRLTAAQEQQFCDLGIVPVATTYMSPALIFNSNQSLHQPPHYSNENARQNARLAAMLQYVLCASRFSHYLKVIMRDEIGTVTDAEVVRRRLEAWLSAYTVGNDDADLTLRTRYPLRSAGIQVHEVPGRPGTFTCTVQLQPHFQLDDVSTTFQLVADTAAANVLPANETASERKTA
nr:type VI secretion system contractile sheath large subunit [Brucella endophytica]